MCLFQCRKFQCFQISKSFFPFWIEFSFIGFFWLFFFLFHSFDCLIHTFKRMMRKDVLVWFLVILTYAAWVCRGQTSEDGKFEIPIEDWPLNGVPFVSEDNEVYPTYEERATLVWSGVVCCSPSLHAYSLT